jgi:hypothetical protein
MQMNIVWPDGMTMWRIDIILLEQHCLIGLQWVMDVRS